ncbi:MAG: D-alanine--poly(phosphoribitol) ligase subunit 2 [Pseudobutyrivibrio ruminis]|nr:D-alanine--poly(phosphoribitol) ligase subunit 2 [Pseudobutyrivibrio ruminis]MBO6129227.1 D-alanine--poly(phosphoribitol) ligase subunit 2 [Pseudobutyrivibrio sp.]
MEQKILDLIYEVCDDKIIYDKRDVNMFDTGLLESMDFIELLMNIEEEFDMEIQPEEIKKDEMATPNKLIAFIQARLN